MQFSITIIDITLETNLDTSTKLIKTELWSDQM